MDAALEGEGEEAVHDVYDASLDASLKPFIMARASGQVRCACSRKSTLLQDKPPAVA
jgi:hypothetical protein